jgi:hypothetical protein
MNRNIAASFSPSIMSGDSMNPKWKITRTMPLPAGTNLMRSSGSTRGVGGEGRDQQHPFVQSWRR